MTENEETVGAPNRPHSKLSAFMKMSITVLSIVTVLAIALLFIGDFQGRSERVFSTLTLFAVFVVLTMIDTKREKGNDWYAPFALMANTYLLGLLLIVIWVTPYTSFSLSFTIFWQSVYVIVLTRLLVLCVEFLFRRARHAESALAQTAQITAVLSSLSLVLFTAPLAFDAFRVWVPELYWKFAVATLILAGLGIAVTLLLTWYFKSQERAAAAEQTLQQAPHYPMSQPPYAPSQHLQVPAAYQGQPAAQQLPPAQQPQPAQQQPQPQPQQPAPATNTEGQPLLPWPTFADGTPFPMKADGQPDFSVLNRD